MFKQGVIAGLVFVCWIEVEIVTVNRIDGLLTNPHEFLHHPIITKGAHYQQNVIRDIIIDNSDDDMTCDI